MEMLKSKRAKNSVFVDTFGEYPLVKVLDFFLMYHNYDYSKTQVAKEIEISRITIEKIWKSLIKNRIIVKTRNMGNAELYKLNIENPKVRVLMKIDMELTEAYYEELKHTVPVKIPI